MSPSLSSNVCIPHGVFCFRSCPFQPLAGNLQKSSSNKTNLSPSSLALSIPTFQFSLCCCHISLELPLQPSSDLLKIVKRKIPLSFTPIQILIVWFLACFGSYWKGNAVIFSFCPSSVWFTILLGMKKLSLQSGSHCLTYPVSSSPRHCLQPSSIAITILPARINIMFSIRLPGRRELLHWRRGEKVSKQRQKTKDR